MRQEKLQKILSEHKKWLESSGKEGKRANLLGEYLRDANLQGADLSGAGLADTKLERADLSKADLSGADLCLADLQDADLRGANLVGADMQRANLDGAKINECQLKDIAIATGVEIVEKVVRDEEIL